MLCGGLCVSGGGVQSVPRRRIVVSPEIALSAWRPPFHRVASTLRVASAETGVCMHSESRTSAWHHRRARQGSCRVLPSTGFLTRQEGQEKAHAAAQAAAAAPAAAFRVGRRYRISRGCLGSPLGLVFRRCRVPRGPVRPAPWHPA